MDSKNVKSKDCTEQKLLSFPDIITRLRASQSERSVLDVLIQLNIDCYIQLPPKKKVYVDIFVRDNNRISPVFEMGFDPADLDRLYRKKNTNEFSHPIELTDPYLLCLDKQDLQNLSNNRISYPILFNGALKTNLEQYYFTPENGYHDVFFYCPVEMQRYAIASIEDHIDFRKAYSFTEGVNIASSDIIVFERDFDEIKNTYFNQNIKEALRMSNSYVSILNFVAFEYYHCNPEVEYNKTDVNALLKKENDKIDRDRNPLRKRELDRLAAIINRTHNPNQGRNLEKQIENKIVFPREIECHRKQFYFSDQLTLVNYLSQYVCKTANPRGEVETEAQKYGLSSSLAGMVVKLIMQKPSL